MSRMWMRWIGFPSVCRTLVNACEFVRFRNGAHLRSSGGIDIPLISLTQRTDTSLSRIGGSIWFANARNLRDTFLISTRSVRSIPGGKNVVCSGRSDSHGAMRIRSMQSHISLGKSRTLCSFGMSTLTLSLGALGAKPCSSTAAEA